MVKEVLDKEEVIKRCSEFISKNNAPNMYFVPDEDILKGYLTVEMYDNSSKMDVSRISFPISAVTYVPFSLVEGDAELSDLINNDTLVGFIALDSQDNKEVLLYDFEDVFSYRISRWKTYSEEVTKNFLRYFAEVVTKKTHDYLNSEFFYKLSY